MSKKIIGVYPMFNTGGICVHAIDDAEDKVLASVNGENPEWCEMAEQPQEDKRICRFAPVEVLTLTIKITASRTEPTLRLLAVYQ